MGAAPPINSGEVIVWDLNLVMDVLRGVVSFLFGQAGGSSPARERSNFLTFSLLILLAEGLLGAVIILRVPCACKEREPDTSGGAQLGWSAASVVRARPGGSEMAA